MAPSREPADVVAGNRLWSLRQAAGLSRRGLSTRLATDPEEPVALSTEAIEQIEKGPTRPFPWDLVPVLARAVGCTPDDLTGTHHVAPPRPGPGQRPARPEPVRTPSERDLARHAEQVEQTARDLAWEALPDLARTGWREQARARLLFPGLDTSTQSDQ